MKNVLIILSIICISLVVALTILILRPNKTKIDRELLIGKWGEISENEQLTFKEDTFKIYIEGSGQNFQGTWEIMDLPFNSATASFLILKNLNVKKSDREEYFMYYFFRIDTVSDNELRLTDLSGALRRNRVNTFKREEPKVTP